MASDANGSYEGIHDMYRSVWMLIAAVILGGVAALEACSDVSAPKPPTVSRPRVRPEWVTGEAAAALDSSTGLFRLSYPTPQRVTVAAADSFALAAARLIGSPNPLNTASQTVEKDRGAPIDFDYLSLCERVLYVHSPFGGFPLEVPGYARRAWGPHWAVSLCGRDGTAQLSIGVPENVMDVQIVNGTLVRPRTQGGGNDFSGAGVPPRFPFGLPLTPEEAVAVVHQMSSQRASTLPSAFNQLDDRGFGQLPLCASWRLSVEAPVRVRNEKTGAVTATQELFVRRFPACYSDSIALYVASANQPTTWPLFIPKDTVTNNPGAGIDTIKVSLVGPVLFEKVSVVR
jgi:hypothetical protein